MVVFICNACGQSVKKNQVEKHYKTVCRQCEVLSCIDCGKDFHGEEYATHTSCISEAEKYQGKLYKAKDKQNKGEQKQQAWIQHVQNASSGISDPRLAGLVDKLSAYDNIPRKRTKFENFCKNSIGVRDASLLSMLWDVFSAKPELPGEESNGAKNGSTGTTDLNSNVQDTEPEVDQTETKTKKKKDKAVENGVEEEVVKDKKKKKKKEKKIKREEEEVVADKEEETSTKKKKKRKEKRQNGEMNGDATNVVNVKKKGKKRKNDSAEEEVATKIKKKQDDNQNVDAEETEQITQPSGKFKWDSVIKKILKEAEDNEMKVKKLRKKVLAEFQSRGGDGKEHSDNELLALFNKKINNNPKFKVHKEKVSLKR